MATSRISIADYLFKRLYQHGVTHIYGVPGDFTLKALDRLQACGIKFVGCCNELNAGYAADGFARAKRWRGRGKFGAVMTTYGVGEMSAANAMACSFAERVPVVHIVGTPSLRALKMSSAGVFLDRFRAPDRTSVGWSPPKGGWNDPRTHLHIHHTLADGRANAFQEAVYRFNQARLNLGEIDASKAPAEIDRVLQEGLLYSKPVYIELPVDKVAEEVDAESPETMGQDRQGGGLELNDTASRYPDDLPGVYQYEVRTTAHLILNMLDAAKRPMILVDRGDGMDDMRPEVQEFVSFSRLPTLALPSGASMVHSETDNYFGVHSGRVGAIDTNPFLQESDLVFAMGPMFSDTQTLGWETVPEAEKMVIIKRHSMTTRKRVIKVDMRAVLRLVANALLPNPSEAYDISSLEDYRSIEQPALEPNDPITQEHFYRQLSPHLKRHDTVLLGNATPIIGGRDLIPPKRAQVIASGMSFSIGHMLPATMGVAHAWERGRAILIDGDGSFQVTAQELSTIMRERLNVAIFIVNNGGYTYERMIHGKDESYNDIAKWNYLALPAAFGAPEDYPVHTARVRTWRDLQEVLESEHFKNGVGLTLVDVIMDKFDVGPKAGAVFEESGRNI